jgi:hypothetical protein
MPSDPFLALVDQIHLTTIVPAVCPPHGVSTPNYVSTVRGTPNLWVSILLGTVYFDMYYLGGIVDYGNLIKCFESYIFEDTSMREASVEDIIKRVKVSFANKRYLYRIENSKAKWMDEDITAVTNEIIEVLQNCANLGSR